MLFWRSGTSGQFYEIAGAEDVFDGSVFFANLQIDISASDSLIQTSESLIKDGYFTVGSKDIAAPEYHSVEISGNTISLCFDEYLDENSIPDASAFSIDINGARTITAVTVSGLKVLLTIDGDAITDADSITLNYTQPVDSPLANLSGHAIANLNNFLFGSAGDDTLVGTAGVDVIVGGEGVDILTGNGGLDIFDYNHPDDGDDIITDFTAGASGDRLDLIDLLKGYNSTSTDADFVTVTDDNANTIVGIDVNGRVGGAFSADLSISLTGVTGYTLEDMINSGNIVL